MDEILNIFDDDLKVIGQETRTNVHKNGYLHEVVHCWVREEGEKENFVYLQQREEFKDFPLLFDISVGGHIDAGEEIEEALLREIREEIGLELSIEELNYEGYEIRYRKADGFLDNEIARIYTYNSKEKVEFNPGIEVKKMVKVRESEFIDAFLNGKDGVNVVELDEKTSEYKTKDAFCEFGREYEIILNNRR